MDVKKNNYTKDDIDSLISKSNTFDAIVKHINDNNLLRKEFIEIRDKLLEDNCQSVAVHICCFIDYLYEQAMED